MEGHDFDNRKHCATVRAYVSPDAKVFYLSKEALIQLQVIPKDFPKIGSATHHEVGGVAGKVGDAEFAECGCRKRTLPPPKPKEFPFEMKDNVPKMTEWLLKR